MTTQARGSASAQNRFVRPLVPILVLLVVGIVFVYLGNFVALARDPSSTPLADKPWQIYLGVGALLAYGISLLVGERDLWKVGTREVVYMAIGAALYGVLSLLTNVVPLPAISQITLRPAIVVPILFGMLFGPAVGFFTGFVGNVLGDALTGWGVSPTWDFGNGLIGLVAGLSVAFRYSQRNLNILTGVIVGVFLVVAAALLTFPNTENVLFGEGTVGEYWWVAVLAAVLVIVARVLIRVLGRSEELAWQQMWGALAIVVGIGFAAIADIWWNGYSLLTALLGEFVPAASSNLINSLILLPLLLAAWQTARAQSGR